MVQDHDETGYQAYPSRDAQISENIQTYKGKKDGWIQIPNIVSRKLNLVNTPIQERLKFNTHKSSNEYCK